MSGRFADRDRGVKLRTLDLSVVQAQANDLADGEGKEAHIGFTPYAMAERAGRLFVICNEGVGWEVTDDKPLRLDLYLQSPGRIAIVPSYVAKLSPDEVRSMATGPEVDLADHVRTFGDRLESNFWTWHHRLTRED